MKLYTENENYKLYEGSMLDMLDVIEPNSIDSIITDPPYELGFMGKDWDNAGVSFNKETWEKCYEALKEGGYMLVFGGSRTYHRIAVAIEDAGFEIRDTIMWLYGAGFPKSMNIGKQLKKRLEDEKTKQETQYKLRLMWERDIQKTKRNEKEQNEVLQSQLQEQSLQRTMYGEEPKESNLWGEKPFLEGWNNIQKTKRELQRCKVCEMSKRVSINGEERWLCNGTQVSDGKTIREMFEKNGSCTSYRPQPKQQQDRELNGIQEQWGTQESREIIEHWNSWGTSLKPSFEPIIVARKPFKGTLIDNVIKNGVGGINIDECRVMFTNKWDKEKNNKSIESYRNIKTKCNDSWKNSSPLEFANPQNENGRFPANTILTYDETDYNEVCGGFPNTKSQKTTSKLLDIRGNNYNNANKNLDIAYERGYTDSGSASRYFYCAKANKRDRNEGLDEFKNIHPTVKPTDLMQYLIRLVSPKGATILDPFNGSGSTGKAVMYENIDNNKYYKYIGIELTEEYLPIAKARIDFAISSQDEHK